MTLDQFEDLSSQFVLGILSEAENQEFLVYLKSANSEEKKLFSKLSRTALQLPAAVELQSPKAELKDSILSKLDRSEKKLDLELPSNQLVMPAFRFAASLVAMFLIGMLFSLSFFSPAASDKLAENSKSSNVQLAKLEHMTQVSNIAMCSHVSEHKMQRASEAHAAGKVYVNKVHDAVVIHICRLPKLKTNESYIVWCVDEDGSTTAIKAIDKHSDDIIEENITIADLVDLEDNMRFHITVERSDHPAKPSEKLMLRS